MVVSFSPADRVGPTQDPTRIHLEEGRAVYKCSTVADLEPDEDHDGHELHIIHWYRGSAAIPGCPPCSKCGADMTLIDGRDPAAEPLQLHEPDRVDE